MLRETLIFLSKNKTAKAIVTHAPFARQAARRFVAGETIDDGIKAAHKLNDQGLLVALDYLGEAVHNEADARAAADVMIEVLDRIHKEQLKSTISVKLTQLGQDVGDAFLKQNVLRLIEHAAGYDIFVRFDMESSAYVQRTIDFFRMLWEEGHRNIGIVLQSYFFRTEDDARMANDLGARVRLCKGAYVEPAELAYQDKTDVDKNFVKVTEVLLEHGTYPAIATHDPAMIRAARDFADAHGIGKDKFEFQLLYGVRRDLQMQLVQNGYNVRVYVGFGEAWYPFFMRRMAERPANMFFVVNNIVKESPIGGLFGHHHNGRK